MAVLPPGVRIRQIEPLDNEKGFFEVLAQLTKAPPISNFAACVQQQRQQDIQQTLVAVNADGRVVGTGAVMIEPKFIRGGAPCAHVEDIVVDESMRGLKLGKAIIDRLVDIAKERGCYKVILDCSDHNVEFYERCGFVKKGTQMAIYM